MVNTIKTLGESLRKSRVGSMAVMFIVLSIAVLLLNFVHRRMEPFVTTAEELECKAGGKCPNKY
jgi:hypothetical protein